MSTWCSVAQIRLQFGCNLNYPSLFANMDWFSKVMIVLHFYEIAQFQSCKFRPMHFATFASCYVVFLCVCTLCTPKFTSVYIIYQNVAILLVIALTVHLATHTLNWGFRVV
jgi:hypothetical protein